VGLGGVHQTIRWLRNSAFGVQCFLLFRLRDEYDRS
jgi:hypothetical protein